MKNFFFTVKRLVLLFNMFIILLPCVSFYCVFVYYHLSSVQSWTSGSGPIAEFLWHCAALAGSRAVPKGRNGQRPL